MDTDIVIFVVFTTLFVLLVLIATVLLFRIYLKRKNRLLMEKEMMSIEFEQTLLRSKLEIQEQTFTYIAKEIHDNIGQVLSLVRININTLSPAQDEGKIDLMDNLMEKAITDLRNLSHSLDTDLIRNVGWVKATEKLFSTLQKTNTYTVIIEKEENLPELGTEKSIILYRMIQEVINNIIKHASAKEIKFELFRQGQKAVINIRDNGKGFDTALAGGGAGLQNLKSRAKMINADFNIQSEPQKGTLVTISVSI